MDWAGGVTARLAALALDRRGRPAVQLLVADAVRCGLVMDLALDGRLTLTQDDIGIDTAPTGFAPAEQLLNATTTEAGRTLTEWLSDGRISLPSVIEALVALGAWEERRTVLGRDRYVVTDRVRAERDKQLDVTVFAAWSPEDAAVAALGSMAHLVGKYRALGYGVTPPEIPEDLPRAAGPAEWVLTSAVDHLRDMRSRYRYGDAVIGSGDLSRP